jgi:hypothetical protein
MKLAKRCYGKCMSIPCKWKVPSAGFQLAKFTAHRSVGEPETNLQPDRSRGMIIKLSKAERSLDRRAVRLSSGGEDLVV